MFREKDFVISLSGIRGIWSQGLTPIRISRLCIAVSQIFKGNNIKKVCLARDTRESGSQVLSIAKKIFKHQNLSIFDLGILPTPTLQIYTKDHLDTAGVMITGSHNPPQYNGLKFLNTSGKILNPKQIKRLIELYRSNSFDQSLLKGKKYTVRKSPVKKAYLCHFSKIVSNINLKKIVDQKFTVAVDPANGAASCLDKIFLEKLGCRVFTINSQVDGVFRRNIEPTSCNLSGLKSLVKEKKLDLGFAQDADADRLAIVDEKGLSLREEAVLSLVITHYLKNRAKTNKKVVVNLATTKSIDEIVRSYHGKLYKTKIGEVNLMNKIAKSKALIGGEGHGGVIWRTIGPGRDSFSAMALILEYLSISKKPLSHLVSLIPSYKMTKDKIPWQKKGSLQPVMSKLKKSDWPEEVAAITSLDGLRIDFSSSWIIIRPSNTEPVLRLIAEAKTRQISQKLISHAKKVICQN